MLTEFDEKQWARIKNRWRHQLKPRQHATTVDGKMLHLDTRNAPKGACAINLMKWPYQDVILMPSGNFSYVNGAFRRDSDGKLLYALMLELNP